MLATAAMGMRRDRFYVPSSTWRWPRASYEVRRRGARRSRTRVSAGMSRSTVVSGWPCRTAAIRPMTMNSTSCSTSVSSKRNGSKAAGTVIPRAGAGGRRSQSTRGVAEGLSARIDELSIRGVRLVEVHPQVRRCMRARCARPSRTMAAPCRAQARQSRVRVPARRASSRLDSPARMLAAQRRSLCGMHCRTLC